MWKELWQDELILYPFLWPIVITGQWITDAMGECDSSWNMLWIIPAMFVAVVIWGILALTVLNPILCVIWWPILFCIKAGE